MIKLYLAEDQELLNTALAMILNLESDIEVVGSAMDGEEALSDILRLKPEIVLLDIEMPHLSGLEIAHQLRLLNVDTKIMILTTFARDSYFQQALKNNVNGYMLKDTPSDQLIRYIRSIMAGDTIFSPELVAKAVIAQKNPLTPRELEVLNLLKSGISTQQIAKILFLSEGTVRNYISAILSKTGTSSRIEAINFAKDQGWI
ncbi:response regulator transcription factor [Enterococcus sp.]|jgi:two-component system response regulator DesR|uniref:response regulator transcription factor n=1 Tax=Enterococcus sp. TaxID=35783 RepID=UPI0025BAC523|nr:response regulator transcription factor [Enterococcus sp.]